jgi:PqqD family protein of HPr-rel-A system
MRAGRWRLDRRAHLHWRRLDDEWVVFDAASGDTHQLDGVSAAALMCLESEPYDREGLSEVLARELDLPPGAELAVRVEDLIEQLITLELIEPVEP